jgi:hypothetical protein
VIRRLALAQSAMRALDLLHHRLIARSKPVRRVVFDST